MEKIGRWHSTKVTVLVNLQRAHPVVQLEDFGVV